MSFDPRLVSHFEVERASGNLCIDLAKHNLLREDILLHFVDGETRSMDLLAGLARAQCPVLVMAGEQDPVCPLADARDMAAALPPQWSELVSFPGVGKPCI